MGIWRNLKARIGLDDDYDEYDDYEEYEDAPEAAPESRSSLRMPYADEPTNIRRVNREPDVDRARDAGRFSSPGGSGSGPVGFQSAEGGPVRAVPQVKIQIVEPRVYSEAQTMADKFKSGMPVIMNLTATDADLAKRLIDFASGLTYGLNGGLQKVSDKVFMLTPANVNVTDAQRAALRDKGLFGLDR